MTSELCDFYRNINKLTAEKKNEFKFYIIYTFTSIISDIEGENEYNNSQQIFSEIKRENNLIELINEKKFKNKKSNNFFILNFYQHELDKINYIISLLKINYAKDDIKFIFIVHIKRIMDKQMKEKIYSIPDIDEKVDQIFIDNLNGLNISLENIEKNGIIGIINILKDKKLFDKNIEFYKALKTYYKSYTNDFKFIENYLPKVITYFDENKKFIEIILSKAFDLIDEENKIKNKKGNYDENIGSFKKIKEEIFNSYITHNTVDIISLIIKDVIIGRILRDAIMKVVDALESDNFITTLLNLDNNISSNSFTYKDNLCQMMKTYLSFANITNIKNKATFKTNNLIPGFLSFYNNIKEFIFKNISKQFFNNEKKLRDLLTGNIIKFKGDFHRKEAELLSDINKEIINDESDKYKFINEVINKCPSDLLLNDYINYFLDENKDNINKNKYILLDDLNEIDSNLSSIENDEEDLKDVLVDDFYVKIIRQIIDLKYNENIQIIKENKNNEFNKFLIKIIWLESNTNYILTIIDLFENAKNNIYKDKKRNILLEQVFNLINKNKIKYITDEKRNPEHTKEVNECFYIILGALYLSITDLERIILYDPNSNKDYIEAQENQVNVKIEKYLECLQYISKVSQPFNDMLYLFSNELYIIVELNSILNLLKIQKNECIDIQIVEKIVNNLRENIGIIQESKFVKTNEMKKNVEDLINLISKNIPNKDNKYYSLLRNILLQEIRKVKDKTYRLGLFKSYIINEKEILLNSNEIFDLLFKGFVNPFKDKFLPSIEKYENKNDDILLVIENKIKDNKNEYLSQILLYYFEKITFIYLDNYFKSKSGNQNEKNLFENEPLNVFKKCLELLSKFTSSVSKIKNISKLLYIGYIRVFLYKFEEYIREKSNKLIEPIKIIKVIYSFENKISFMAELFFYKIIYYKNNRDINIFSSSKNLYKLESFFYFKDFNSQINDDNSGDENDDKTNLIIDLLEENTDKIKNSKEEYPFYEYFYYSDYIDEKYLISKINNETQEKYPVLEKYLELKNNGNLLDDFYIYNKALNCINEEYSSKITREQAKIETLDKQLKYQDNKDLFDKFIEIYNKLSDNSDDDDYNDDNDDNDDVNNNNKINKKLEPSLPLFNFFIFDENKYSEKYKKFYKAFINKHNEIIRKLLNSKCKNSDNQIQTTNMINIQNITKEEEIFIIKNNLSILNIIFNYSYRKVVINDNFSEFNVYEINLEYIEDMLTDKLLKNKNLISDEIFEFKYKNEDFEFKNKDICTKFKEKFEEEELGINDKIIFYLYFEDNKSNVKLHLRLLDEFAYLIIYSTENIDKIEKPSKTKIYKFLEELEQISNDFKGIFKEKNSLTINKLLNIYEYYQILCFNIIKQNLIQYQVNLTVEEKNLIDNYLKNDLKRNKEINNYIETALRKFILCFLTKESNKENKIKLNENNIKNYLEIEDLWDKEFYKKDEFYKELKKIKNLGIKINNIIHFYDKCFNNNYKNYFDDVKEELNKRKEEENRKIKEKDKNDISNFNAKDPDIDDDNQKGEEDNKIDDNTINENGEDNNGDDYMDQEVEEEEDNVGRY